MFTLVTAHRRGRLERCQPIEPEAPQNAADGRWRDAQFGCDLLAGVALAAETPDLGDHRLRRRPMQPIGPRTAITQPSQALAAISGNPIANGPRADACGFADGLRRLPALNLPYNSLSTVWRQTGILVPVHPVLPCNLKSQQPQLPWSEPDGQPAESSHLERLPLGTSYPAVVQRVKDLLSRPPLNGHDGMKPAELVLDATGVGQAVADVFDEAGLPHIRITITAEAEVTAVARNRWHVSKSVLISTVEALLHLGELRFAAALSESGAMRDELLDFRRSLSAAGRATYAARTGKHDHLVLAVAIGCWWLGRPLPAKLKLGGY